MPTNCPLCDYDYFAEAAVTLLRSNQWNTVGKWQRMWCPKCGGETEVRFRCPHSLEVRTEEAPDG